MADDLLADLLSDNDDSLDSFYNLDTSGTSKQTNKQPIPATSTSTTSNKQPKPNTAESWLGLDFDLELEPKKTGASQKPTSILHRDDGPSRKKPTKKISFEDDADDILGTLGMSETQKPETAKPSQRPKSAIMEDIFGPSKPIGDHPTSLEDVLKDSIVAKSNKKETAAVAGQKYVATSSVQQEGRMSRRQSSAVFDSLTSSTDAPALRQPRPLSRQSSADKPIEELTVTTNKGLSKSLPDWLGGSPSKPKAEPEAPKQEQDVTDKIPDPTIALQLENHPSLDSLLTQQKFSASQIEYQNTSIALQQQESQLLVALQLKKYEENLMGMQKKQQDILIKQEQQFNSLLERQFAKQQMMENNMRLQQERINNHIQLLVAQGPSTGVGVVISEDREKMAELERVVVEENSRMYEKIIGLLKERHREEVFVMEESYKKQISYLEQQIDATENKLKSETASFSETLHQEKLALKAQYDIETENWKDKLQESRTAHASELKLVRENHERIIEEIKYEYSSMIDNLKRVKAAEVSAMENGSEYSKKLDMGLERLLENSRELEAIGGKVRAEYGVLAVAREASIESREKEVYLMKSALEKARESTETERSQLMSLIRSLELKLVEQSENSREERWAFQQATATLAARAHALDRETEFNQASLERERNQLKSLKESVSREQEKAMLELTEEKLRVSAERTSLETSAKLKHDYDSQKAQKDAEAAIRVAKESTEQTDRERDILYKQQAEVEALQRSLFDKEQKLNFRESELQSVIEGAERKAAEGERALLESKSLQAKYNERLKQIQRQLGSLANRERKLSEDKIVLSKERLAFQSSLRDFSRCSLCRSNVKVPQVEEFEEAVEQDVPMPRFMVSDPQLLRLRYELIEEQHPEQHIEESHTSL